MSTKIGTDQQIGKTRIVSLKSIMWTAQFRKGYDDCKLGNPWFDGYSDSRSEWCYTRGRHFAALYPNIPLKHGKKVNYEAIRAMADAVQNKYIL
jgi:hypothetical protein